MVKIIDRCRTRGMTRTNWLVSHHTFSFNMYYNPDRVGFGALLVLNDDTVRPSKGFGRHPHENMEIVSIPLSGELSHSDSEGHSKSIKWGEIQTMTAGTGIFHSEMNENNTEECKFLQIWVTPREQGLKPDYHDYDISSLLKHNQLNVIVSPDDEVPATLHQDAWFSIGDFDANIKISYKLHRPNFGIYMFMLDGKANANDETLNNRDGMGIDGISQVDIETLEPSRILLIEVPMK